LKLSFSLFLTAGNKDNGSMSRLMKRVKLKGVIKAHPSIIISLSSLTVLQQ
jgi:hypothetical protein